MDFGDVGVSVEGSQLLVGCSNVQVGKGSLAMFHGLGKERNSRVFHGSGREEQ